MHVSRREATLFDAAFQRDANSRKVEDHAVNDRPWRKGDLAETDEFRPPMPDGDFRHADGAAADLDTHASRRHQRAPDTETEPTVLQVLHGMLRSAS